MSLCESGENSIRAHENLISQVLLFPRVNFAGERDERKREINLDGRTYSVESVTFTGF